MATDCNASDFGSLEMSVLVTAPSFVASPAGSPRHAGAGSGGFPRSGTPPEDGTAPTDDGSEVASQASSPRTVAARAPDAESYSVRAMVRVRPFNTVEWQSADTAGTSSVPTSVLLARADSTLTVLNPQAQFAALATYQYDRVFWSVPESQQQLVDDGVRFATQEDVFEHAGVALLEAVISGRNACVFAYGQTGSGKTHTMLGHKSDPGLIPRIMQRLFDLVTNGPRHIVCTVEASFLEIYNEKVRDLLDAACTSQSSAGATFCERKVRRHPGGGTFVEGLRREKVANMSDYENVMRAGTAFRTTAATSMNDQSSRSHAILQLFVSFTDNRIGRRRHAALNLVDLAGSERIKMSQVSGINLIEAKNINLSLTTLRRVIDALVATTTASSSGSPAVVPYRESMLTWVLCDSLGGNCVTIMLAAVSPHMRNLEDTHSTLKYAYKAKAITCHVKVNAEKCAVTVQAIKTEMNLLKKMMDEDAQRRLKDDELRKHDEDELKDRQEQAQKDHTMKALAKTKLQSQLLRHKIELRRKQRQLSERNQVHLEAEKLRAIREETELMQKIALEQMQKEKEMESRLLEEIRDAEQLSAELAILEASQRARELEAQQREQVMNQQAFSQIFKMAVQSSKDRIATTGQEARIEQLHRRAAAAEAAGAHIDALYETSIAASDILDQRFAAAVRHEEDVLRALADAVSAEQQERQFRDIRVKTAELRRLHADVLKETLDASAAVEALYRWHDHDAEDQRQEARQDTEALVHARRADADAAAQLASVSEEAAILDEQVTAANQRWAELTGQIRELRKRGDAYNPELSAATDAFTTAQQEAEAVVQACLSAEAEVAILRRASDERRVARDHLSHSYHDLREHTCRRVDLDDATALVAPGEVSWQPPLNLPAGSSAEALAVPESDNFTGPPMLRTPSRPVLTVVRSPGSTPSDGRRNASIDFLRFSRRASSSIALEGSGGGKEGSLSAPREVTCQNGRVPSLPLSPRRRQQ